MKTTQELKELLYKNKTVADQQPDAIAEANAFCEGYKAFLNAAKSASHKTNKSPQCRGLLHILYVIRSCRVRKHRLDTLLAARRRNALHQFIII